MPRRVLRLHLLQLSRLTISAGGVLLDGRSDAVERVRVAENRGALRLQ